MTFSRLLEKPHSRNGDFCDELSMLVLFTKAQFGDVKEAFVVIFVFWLAFAANEATREKLKERVKFSHVTPSSLGDNQ